MDVLDQSANYMSSDIVKGEDGKFHFLGTQKPDPPKAEGEGSKMECPVCHALVDYLVGDDTPDGGRRGCENCWKPAGGAK